MAFVILVAAMPVVSSAAEVKIATFNIQNFGKTKAANPTILAYLGKVIRKFDIVAVQEISDATQVAPNLLLNEVNRTGRNYGLLLSDRTGKQADDRSSQEQYGFYYDADRIASLDDGRLFNDRSHDLFQREPYTAEFAIVGTTFAFTITTIHTRPESAVDEIGALDTVYLDVVRKYPDDFRHLILGDFNGDCDYAPPAQLDALAIRAAPYHWIVPDSADTNLNPNRSCAYDRILANDAMNATYKNWGIANWFVDPKISDHWPVWVTFTSR